MKALERRALRELGDEHELPSDLLVGWLHGTLTDAERARVEALSPRARDLARALAADRAPVSRPSAALPSAARPRTWRRRSAWAGLAAASLLLAFVVVHSDPREARAARALHAGDFERAASLVFGPENAAWPVGARRSIDGGDAGLRVLQPAPLCFAERPRIVWAHARAGGPYRLRLVDEDWRELARWRADGSPTTWPAALADPSPGRMYLLEIQDLAHPSTVARHVVRVVEHARRDALRAELTAIPATRDPALDHFRRAWCRARHRDRTGAAAELSELVGLLGEDAREPLLAYLGDPSLGELLAPARDAASAVTAEHTTDGTEAERP